MQMSCPPRADAHGQLRVDLPAGKLFWSQRNDAPLRVPARLAQAHGIAKAITERRLGKTPPAPVAAWMKPHDWPCVFIHETQPWIMAPATTTVQ